MGEGREARRETRGRDVVGDGRRREVVMEAAKERRGREGEEIEPFDT